MKNVTRLPRTEVFLVEIPGVLQRPLWAVKYVSGIDDSVAEVKPGDWLAQWEPSPERIRFAFSKDRNLYFTDETSAQSVSGMLRKDMEIETDVTRVS